MQRPDADAPAATTTVVLCVHGGQGAFPAARLRRLDRLCAEGRHEVLAVGWGPPEAAEDVLRELAAGHPHVRAILHARRVSRSEALCAAVAAARTPWILLAGREEPSPSMPVAPKRGADCVLLEAGSLLFAREAFVRLPRIPGMARWLPELFARAGLRVVAAGGVEAAPWFRHVGVAILCRMAGAADPAASRA